MEELIQIIVGGLQVGCVYAIIALGFSLVYRVTNVINLGQGAFCLLGALGAYTMQTTFGWGLPASALAAVLFTVAVGTFVGYLAFVPGLSRLSNANMLTLMERLILVVWGSQPYAMAPFSG